jgi:cell division protein FtsN
LNAARPLVDAGDVELRNQFDYFVTQCERLPVADSVATPAQPAPEPAAATATKQYSVQVAAFNAHREATALASRLKERGFDVRVVGDRAPYRVRVGRYETHADAAAALARMRASRVNGIVVEAEPK